MRGPARPALLLAAAIIVMPVLARAQFTLDATPTPAGATPTPTATPDAIPVTPVPVTEGDLTGEATPVPGLDAIPTATPGATPKPPKTPGVPGAFDPGLPGQWGYPGALRVVSASPGDPGITQFAAGLEFFSEPGFIAEGKNHRRTVNTLAVDHTLSKYLAASVVILSMANHSAATNPLYIAAIGDLDVSARFTLPLTESESSRFSAGVRGGAKIMQGDGPGKGVGESASPYVRGLATYETSALRVSADAGYFVDRSAALVPEDTEPDAGQLYAYGVSDYNAVLAGAAIDFPAWRVSPFAELTTRIDLGAEGEPATIATGGIKISSASRRVSVLAALDYGLAGKKIEEGRLRVPTWNAVGGFSYSFGSAGPRPPRIRRVVVKNDPEPKAAPVAGTTETTGRLKGKVLAMATRTGIPNATIVIENGPTLTTDASGAFDAQGLAAGTARYDVKAAGYQARPRNSSYVTAGQITSVVIYLFAAPAAPPPEPQVAFVKGKVVSTKGKPLAATVSVTYAGKSKEVKTDAKGAYKLDLQEGDYSLTITAPGMKPQTHSGKLAPKESFELDFMLLTDKKKTPGTTPKKGTTAKKPK